MSTYYREQGFKGHRGLWYKLRFVFFLLLLVAIAVLGFLAYDIYRQGNAADMASAPTTPVTSTISSNSQILRSPHFQFQATNKWRAITSESKDGHYVYRQFNSHLVEQELVVDVNRDAQEVLALTKTTRVLPVTIDAQGTMLDPGPEVSDHCAKALPKGSKANQIVKYKEVTFACNADGTSFVVTVGQMGGTNVLTLQRPSGDKATYKITYKNVSANPSSRDLVGIIRTFETR